MEIYWRDMLDAQKKLFRSSPQAQRTDRSKDTSPNNEQAIATSGNRLADRFAGTERPPTHIPDEAAVLQTLPGNAIAGMFAVPSASPPPPLGESRIFQVESVPPWIDKDIANYFQLLSQENDVSLEAVVYQAEYPGHPRLASPGRCQAMACAHLYAAINDDFPALERHLTTPEGHTALQMAQRGLIKVYDMANEAEAKVRKEMLTAQYGKLGRLARRALRLPTPLPAADVQSLWAFHNQTLDEISRLSIPGARAQRTDIGKGSSPEALIARLSPGYHFLLVHDRDGKRRHALSCVISTQPYLPSQLLEPNACFWRGDQANLARVLQQCWEDHGWLEAYGGSVDWDHITLTHDQPADPD